MVSVIHVSSAHPWNDNRIHYREALSLAQAGFEVSLVGVATESKPGQGLVSVRTIPPLRRSFRVLISTLRAVAAAVSSKARIVHLHDPELIWAVPLLRFLGRTVVYDAHEDLPVQVLDKPYANRFTRPVLRWVANVACRLAGTATAVIAATEQVATRFPRGKVTVVRNFPPLLSHEEKAPPVDRRAPHLVYVGAIGNLRGAEVMVRAMSEPDMPEGWTLSLAGRASAQLLAKLEGCKGWERVDYHGVLTPQEARDLVLRARVGIAVLQATPAYVDALPTKMFEYFAAGVPVIASDFPLWRSIVDKYQCGQLVDEKDPRALARAVRRYAEEPELLERHSVNARRAAVAELNWANEARKLVGVYEDLAVKGVREQ